MSMGQQIEMLRVVKKALVDDKPSSAEECILLHTFPSDHVTSQGVKFWSGTKRCPHTLLFDAEEENHFEFVYAASVLHAQQYNLQPILDVTRVKHLAAAYNAPKLCPGVGQDCGAGDDDSETIVGNLNVSLAKLKLTETKPLTPIDFEKDDDSNHHVEFVTATSNLRAYNYDIPVADKSKTKQIAAVAGLVCLELYKTIDLDGQRCKTPIERFKNGFINWLAVLCFHTARCIYFMGSHRNQRTNDFGELIEYVKTKTSLEVSMMSSGVSLLYAFFQPPAKVAERLAKDVVEQWQKCLEKPC
uniref:Uncharacterized protein n=1 Tax=Ditylenchus dipsaci TaxID=166011 RepID=A0A915D130_9BILA